MLFHKSQVILQARADALDTLRRIIKEIDVTDKVSITMFMDYLYNIDVTIQYKVFQEARWMTNKPLYEACIKYEYKRFRQISIDLKAFIQGPMTDFVKRNPIHHSTDISMTPYLNEALDALEASFWLGVTSAYL